LKNLRTDKAKDKDLTMSVLVLVEIRLLFVVKTLKVVPSDRVAAFVKIKLALSRMGKENTPFMGLGRT
jgi:hypothetical protein